jgi:hypothetical protein
VDINDTDSPLFCDRCTKQLHPGDGDFFVIRIEACADPTPPVFSLDDLQRDHRQEIARLCDELSRLSEQELNDQIYRRLTIFLCGVCYAQWIENPTGSWGN